MADARLVDSIHPGDRVTIVDRFGKPSTGRAVMPAKGGIGWVLNMGGKHGTPGIATDENVVKVSPAKRGSTMVSKHVVAELVSIAKELVAGTFKCPDCGAKVLENTGYCLSCKKKVKPSGGGDKAPAKEDKE